ncbi:MAG: class I SAM-dependent methyltransferase [Acidimicrobiia bacterium]|nr:class I SAM-dependent methyltransferase [Acidimicrobiia bacterium]
MSGCCDPRGYRQVFNAAQAAKAVRAFEQKGLDGTARPMIAALRAEGFDGATVLEVGAGPATALVTLLEAGAGRAVAYDISPSYERVAGALLQGRGLTNRVEWHTGDYLASGDDRPAEVVFLNRVVCCYPDIALVGVVADRASRLLALSYPRRRWYTRSAIRMINGYLWLRRVPFRVFVHDPGAIARNVIAAGFEEVAGGASTVWEWKVWRRAA